MAKIVVAFVRQSSCEAVGAKQSEYEKRTQFSLCHGALARASLPREATKILGATSHSSWSASAALAPAGIPGQHGTASLHARYDAFERPLSLT